MNIFFFGVGCNCRIKLVYCIIGPEKCRNWNLNFTLMRNEHNRCFSKKFLDRTLANGRIIDRDWVIFSPKLKGVLCFPCKLFGSTSQNIETFRTTGFNDWRNTKKSFEMHEKSFVHIKNYMAYRNRAKGTRTLDQNILKQEEVEMKYWREILLRIVSVIKFLAAKGLPLYGSNQTIGSDANGNFLGILEVVSKYDTLLESHLMKYGN